MEEEDDQEALNKAILQSLQSSQAIEATADNSALVPENTNSADDDLKRAISLSLEGEAVPSTSTAEACNTGAIADSIEFIRQRRLLRLGQLPSANNP